jgi:surfeit locus 1 family protein
MWSGQHEGAPLTLGLNFVLVQQSFTGFRKGRTIAMTVRARILVIGCFVGVAAVCARLGIWQVHRLEERRAANAAAMAARSAPPVVLNRQTPLDSTLVNRRVRATGRYDHTNDIVLRGKQYRGVPGVELVSPLLLEGERVAVLVNRGFVPTPDAVTVEPDSLREPGQARVEGIALPIASGGGSPLQRGDRTTWTRLDQEALRGRLPYPIYPVYVRQIPDTALPPFPRRLEPPALDDGSHLSYAIQWFAFAVMAVVFGGVIVSQKRER